MGSRLIINPGALFAIFVPAERRDTLLLGRRKEREIVNISFLFERVVDYLFREKAKERKKERKSRSI